MRNIISLLVVVSMQSLLASAQAGAIRYLPGFTNTVFLANDDGTYPANGPDSGTPPGTPETVPIGFNINFYGETFSNLYVNNNGNVTFGQPLSTFTPFGLVGTATEIIAPFFADVDTRMGNLVTFGNDTVNGHPAFGVDWFMVGYYDELTDKLDSFQVILIDRSDRNAGDFDIEFNYDQIDWETGEASGGTDGLGGSSAVVGYSNGSGQPGTYFQLPGSGIPGELLDSNPGGLVHGYLNTNLPGRYLLPIVNPTNLVLSVERFSQGDARWAADAYAGGDFTIQQQGCALSTLAMALHYAGLATDPGALNTLMIASNDFVGNAVEWDRATRDASAFTLQFHPYRTSDTEYLSETLENGYPVIVGVNLNSRGAPGHFVLVIGELNGQFLINDPGHADRTNLTQYGNIFETRGYVGGTDDPSLMAFRRLSLDGTSLADLSSLDADVGNAADELVVDPLGRRTGYDPVTGDILEEIPQSAHFMDCIENNDLTDEAGTNTAHLVEIYNPSQGNYYTVLTGSTNAGQYRFSLSTFSQNGTPSSFINQQGTATSGTTVTNASIPVVTAAIVQTLPAGTNSYDYYGAQVQLCLAGFGTNALTFQWTENGQPLSDGGLISGSATPCLSVGSVTNTNQYAVIISSTSGSVTSQVFTLDAPASAASAFVADTYNGLFYPPEGVSVNNSGAFTLTLTKTGKFSSSARFAAGSVSFAGTLDADGYASVTNKQPGKNGLIWILHLQKDMTPGLDRIAGNLTDGTYNAGVYMYLAGKTPETPATGSQQYTLALLGQTNGTNLPPGYGALTGTLSDQGALSLSGKLADGTALSQSMKLCTNGLYPLFSSLYSEKGMLLGWLEFTNNTPAGDSILWVKPNGLTGQVLYKEGFTNVQTVIGSLYVKPTSPNNALVLTNGRGELIISAGNLTNSLSNIVEVVKNKLMVFSNVVSVSSNNMISTNLVSTNLNKIAVTLNPATGTFSGSFVTYTTKKTGKTVSVTDKTFTLEGVVLQQQAEAVGWFLGTNQAGSVLLQSNP